ncbi:homocysteine S-methyltransferase family protein [Geomonas propionica]|uniref:Homocysteine S-methyltransferase family protein n=1 Tax=Geomonas propionica TaxID=2798582 RepID=A0ABS0YYV5_9BACT|nr:homocysteine S-methyltransferase family protein [Geomonas propionica]MBJ6802687.1 homocysteine S-methyltransferase family protein [Geomonas propionica]
MNTIDTFLSRYPFILGEGAVIERLRRMKGLELDPFVVNSAFIYHDEKRRALEGICREYLDIGCQAGLPLLMSTPTWRASRERIAAAGLDGTDLNGDNAAFLEGLRQSYQGYADKILICGLMSCKGDAYHPAEALPEHQAAEYHAWQAEKLAATTVDFLLAATLPALSEATGLALALARTGKPYMVSFVVRPTGTLLDGTPLKEAIAAIDAVANPKPLGFMINCTHVTFARSALLHETNSSAEVRRRIIGLLANTAALSPEDLDNSSSLVEQEPEAFGASVAAMGMELGLKILGGCCGTDGRHLSALATRLQSPTSSS